MAEGVLGLEVDLGHGAAVGGEIEEWVVTEAPGSARLGEDLTFDYSVADGEKVSVTGGGEYAVVAGRPLGEWDPGEERDEVEIVALVDSESFASIGCVKVVVIGEARGAYAWASMKCVDLKAGVVGDDDLAWGVVGVEARFDGGVALEGEFVFCGGADF
jgi:hypothetical protein